MSAPLSDYWVLEYRFWNDTFEVLSLPEYLTRCHKAYQERKLYHGVVVAIHPNKPGADDAFMTWALRREEFPATLEERLKEFRNCADLLEFEIKKRDKSGG